MVNQLSPGVYKSLVRDNGISSSETFNLLNDCRLVLRTIYSSLSEMAVGVANGKEDLLVLAFKQLCENFEEKFFAAFPHSQIHSKWGCHILHETNCSGCEVLVEASKISSCNTKGKQVMLLKKVLHYYISML